MTEVSDVAQNSADVVENQPCKECPSSWNHAVCRSLCGLDCCGYPPQSLGISKAGEWPTSTANVTFDFGDFTVAIVVIIVWTYFDDVLNLLTHLDLVFMVFFLAILL